MKPALVLLALGSLTSAHLPWHFPRALSNATTAFLNGTASPTRASNSSLPSSLPTAAANSTNTTISCAATGSPFLLQVSAPSANTSANATAGESLFNNWFVHLVGSGLLFTSKQSSASSFAIDGVTGNLCAVGYVGEKGNPVAAIVETQAVNGSAVWMLDEKIEEIYEPQYEPLTCSAGSGSGSGNGTASGTGSLACSQGMIRYWFGCGLQLDMSGEASQSVYVGGLQCQAIQLEMVSP